MIIYKKCNKCEIEKNLNLFGINKSSKSGYSSLCRECFSQQSKEYRDQNKEKRAEYDRNREYDAEKRKEYYDNNKEILLSKCKEYYQENRDIILSNMKDYSIKNKDKRNIRECNRRKYDPLYRLIINTRNLINNSFYNMCYSKTSKTQEILGCSFEEFKKYLEFKFEEWMSWENRGLYDGSLNFGWDIDHIIPLSEARTEEELIKLNHYSNLQPLCSKVNRDIKKNNII